MSKVKDAKKEFLQTQLRELETAIQAIESQGGTVPQSFIDSRNKLKSQLNPNKFNAKKVEWNGILFDSTFEKNAAEYYTSCGIPYKHQVKFVLQEPFDLKYPDKIYNDEKIREIAYNADFVIEDRIIIDTKGNHATQTRTFEDKWKMLKNKHRDRYIYLLVTNRQELILSVGIIKRILNI